MSMVTYAACERCGQKSENPGADLWKQVRVYPIGAVFELCQQCAADTLEFMRKAPEGSVREKELAAEAQAAKTPKERPIFLEEIEQKNPAKAERVRRLVAEGKSEEAHALAHEALGKVAAGRELADEIVSNASKKDGKKRSATPHVAAAPADVGGIFGPRR